MKICSICKLSKPIEDFGINRAIKDGLQNKCKKCNYEVFNNYRKEHLGKMTKQGISILYTRKKAQCKNTDILFEINKNEFISWYLEQNDICCYCGIKGSDLSKAGEFSIRSAKRLTLDRLDSSKGYVLENMALCCQRCNFIKSNFFSPEEMKEIADKYIKPRLAKLLEL